MKESATRLADIMTRTVSSIEPDSTLEEAYEKMRGAGIHHLVVMKAGRVAGVLSERDVERARGTGYASGDDAWTVEEVMSARVVVAAPETTAREAAVMLRGHAIGCLPVMDGKQLVGIVTTSDLLDLLAQAKLHGRLPAEAIEEDLDEEARVTH
jgi:acetoin utilization protein AcuB